MHEKKLIGTINAVLVGKAVAYTRLNTLSAIDKKPKIGQVNITAAGLVGDEQGDRIFHGGLDKAVHFYAYEHYKYWNKKLVEHDLLQAPGAFGENISTLGISENDVCIGDQLLIGDALFEISQARQPCWKLNDRFSVNDMAYRVQYTLLTGFYCRVLKPGVVKAGDKIYLSSRIHPDWSLLRLMQLLYHTPLNHDLLLESLKLPLTASWRAVIENRLKSGCVEDWLNRLEGPIWLNV